VGVDSSNSANAYATILIILLLVIVLVFLPVIAWMYVDIRAIEIRVDRALKKIEK